MVFMTASGTVRAVQNFLCALRCIASQSKPKTQLPWEQLRASLHPTTRKSRVPGAPGLRRKEVFFCPDVYG